MTMHFSDFLIISRLADDTCQIQNRSGRARRSGTKPAQDQREDLRHLLKEICFNFFSEDAPSPIPLTNQVEKFTFVKNYKFVFDFSNTFMLYSSRSFEFDLILNG